MAFWFHRRPPSACLKHAGFPTTSPPREAAVLLPVTTWLQAKGCPTTVVATGPIRRDDDVTDVSRERDESGQYVEEVTPEQIVEVFRAAEVPVLTAREVAEQVDCSRSAAYNKLESLVEEGRLRKKKVGARAVVYIRL